MPQKEMIAMILAGGQGSRLGVLTKKNAKPAVPFGGKYRIIDFTLSNCSNSGIYTVGILTQYKPLILNNYIGIGAPWDLDRSTGGVSILQPYTKENGGKWYNGTADAIYQNRQFIDSYNPEYVLILSGDHIYKMDYSKMLNFHKKKNADATISVINVTLKEASRFGIMNTKEDNIVYEFEEKPKKPKSTKASMGIYIFNWKTLLKYLKEDQEDQNSSNDFGKNIIPKMIQAGKKVYAYPFEGYWKDVGTVESLWEANMDLISDNNTLNIHDSTWKIYSLNPTMPPHFAGEEAEIRDSLVSEGCIIHGKVYHSVLFPGVYIGKDTIIKDSVIMPNTTVGCGCSINKAVIGSNAVMKDRCAVGKGDDIALLGDGSKVESGESVC